MSNGPLNLDYPNLFILYCKKHDTGGYHIGHKPIGLEGIYGERQVIYCRAVINNRKIFLSRCLLRWFPSASEGEKMAFTEIITLDYNVFLAQHLFCSP